MGGLDDRFYVCVRGGEAGVREVVVDAGCVGFADGGLGVEMPGGGVHSPAAAC